MVDDSGEIEVNLFKFVWYYKENLDTINKTDLLHAEMHDDPWWDLSKKKNNERQLWQKSFSLFTIRKTMLNLSTEPRGVLTLNGG